MNHQPTVYIVDNDSSDRNAMAALAKSRGARCETFESAEQYLNKASDSRPGCLLLDHQLGGRSGLELQRKLNELGVTIPIVVVTGVADVRTVVQYFENGALSLIEKPFEPDNLGEAIDRAIGFDTRQRALADRLSKLNGFDQKLTSRERVVCDLVTQGTPNKAIARELNVSVRTVETVRAKVLQKFDAQNAAELSSKAQELRLLSEVMFARDKATPAPPAPWGWRNVELGVPAQPANTQHAL